MKKRITAALVMATGFILVMGFVNMLSLQMQILDGFRGGVYIDGSDFTSLFALFGGFTALLVGLGAMLLYAGFAAALWGVYGIALLIARIVRRRKGPPAP